MTTVVVQKEALHETSIASAEGSGRRLTWRKWFHTSRKDKVEDDFQEDECISLEEAESLVFVPSFHLNSSYTFPETSPEIQVRTHRNRQKIRELKKQLTLKLHRLKHRYDKVESQRLEKPAKKTFDRHIIEEPISVKDLFNNTEEHHSVDVKEETKNKEQENLQKSELPKNIANDDEANETFNETEASSGASCRMKRPCNNELSANSSFKRSCSTKDLSSASSVESLRNDYNGDEDEQNSIQNTPPDYLTKSPTLIDDTATLGEQDSIRAPPCPKSRTESDDDGSLNMKSAHADVSSDDSSLSDDISTTMDDTVSEALSCAASVTCEKVYTIPTFRKRKDSLNVANIVKSFRDGTLNEEQLIEFADKGKKRNEDLTFKNKEFYDDPASKAPIDTLTDKVDKDKCLKDSKINVKNSVRSTGKKGEGAVKFDRFSCLIVYKPSTKSSSLVNDGVMSLRDCDHPQGSIRRQPSQTRSVRQKPEGCEAKSILKIKANTREKEEIRRAIRCDEVDIESFMNLFEHFENKKQMEEIKLGEVREDQLNHYYSEQFFPEILEDVTVTTAHNSEFSRSRKATELNIGRNLGAIKCGLVHYVCPTCDTKVL